ncbi:MAG: peptidoglycan DD-metalloendopeptidase family protein [Bdellovibrionales bacterium]|nr:peptidoglycan DD-metalloendopeptidase family protein [Bdellovibrionales bacterium]
MKNKLLLAVFSLLFANHASVAEEPADQVAISNYLQEKEKVVTVDQQSRAVMSTLYQINTRMKSISRHRDILNNKVISAEGNVQSLAKDAAQLEEKITEQRALLSDRLRAIYMLGDDAVVRVIFSSASAQDLDQSLKYLKLISDHDYKRIKSFETNLKTLKIKKDTLNAEVRRLLTLKDKFQTQEKRLALDQESKSAILERLNLARADSLTRLTKLRKLAKQEGAEGLFDLSFYEQRGKLKPPVVGSAVQEFGMTEHPEFRYRLSHKGNRYVTPVGSSIQSIYSGRVSFVGEVDGYGSTVVIDHGDHYYSVYSHIHGTKVTEGQRIASSELIGNTAEEFYFEIRHFSDAIDPKRWLKEI